MSKGPGTIERRIADLFAATRDRALDISEIARYAFELSAEQQPTRTQRLSATRAAHRVVRRAKDAHARAQALVNAAHAKVKATLGRDRGGVDQEYDTLLDCQPAMKAARALLDAAERVGSWDRLVRSNRPGYIKLETDFWGATTLKGRLYFHPPDVPVRVWAVEINRTGVHWFEAEVTKVTATNVMVRYSGVTARLNREKLWYWCAWWRGVRFVSSRTGRIANALDEQWHRRHGKVGSAPPFLQMPLAQAMALLGVPADYTREDVLSAFRRAAKKAHPDLGGTAEMFRVLVEARDRLLAALGASAPPPKPPDYAPKGVQVVYRVTRSNRRHLGSGARRLTSA
jgi:hypothetical protein